MQAKHTPYNFALCKSGNFNIQIWASLAIHLVNKGNQVLFIIWCRINKLFGPRKRAWISLKLYIYFLVTVYTLNSHLLTLKVHNHKMYVVFFVN